MPINSRNKLLNDLLIAKGHEGSVKRNLEQYQTKGMADLYFKNFAIECKRYKERADNWPISKWWTQTLEAAGKDYTPILIYKYDRQEIKAVLPLSLLNDGLDMDPQRICVTSLRHFLEIAGAKIENII